jgi:hypothetical protein
VDPLQSKTDRKRREASHIILQSFILAYSQ